MTRRTDLRTATGFEVGGLSLRPFAGDGLMVVRVEGPAGSEAPDHTHPHEQMTLVEAGRVRLRLDDDMVELGAGECLHIPSGAVHGAVVLEDTVFFDIFHPVREDFLERIAPE
jgi:quercetin dioxygenase-like cupin family protein